MDLQFHLFTDPSDISIALPTILLEGIIVVRCGWGQVFFNWSVQICFVEEVTYEKLGVKV